jgi:hypothetical protein
MLPSFSKKIRANDGAENVAIPQRRFQRQEARATIIVFRVYGGAPTRQDADVE